MKRLRRIVILSIVTVIMSVPRPARADIWGGDVVVLTQLLVNAIQQLVQLKQILGTSMDTLSLMREINRGIRDGLTIVQTMNPRFNPGLYGNLETADRVLTIISDLYGRIPQTAEYRLQEAQDRSASESIAMNSTLFRYADQVDEESRRILSHSQEVNPQGAAKLTAQAVAILIGVSTQVLRTNSMMLKMMGENMALSNRKEKLQAAQFRTQYDGLSTALGKLPKKADIKPLEQ